MKTFEVHAIVSMVFPGVKANSPDEAIARTAEKIPVTIAGKECGTICAITIDDISAKSYDLMDASNNHDPDLVEHINSAYNEKPEEFAKIVDLLARRDIDEWQNPEFYAKGVWARCHEYCQTIADNCDLRTILSYCRL